MTKWTLHHPRARREDLGFLPLWLNENNPATAKDQLNFHYSHGGGWQPFYGFEADFTIANQPARLVYPQDPPLPPLASTNLRDELVVLYPFGWVAIFQPNGDFEVARMD